MVGLIETCQQEEISKVRPAGSPMLAVFLSQFKPRSAWCLRDVLVWPTGHWPHVICPLGLPFSRVLLKDSNDGVPPTHF